MIIGIDFGTSKSVVAIWDKRTSTTIPDLQGRTAMPSLVLVAPDEQLHIGWEALNHPLRYQSEYFTISSIKRMIGKAGETEWGHFRTYPQEVSALILGRLKMYAEAYCDSEITKAVIAVPAHYNINQRWATKQAAEIAGLKALRLVNEATAAVLAYSVLHKKGEGFAIVFDFGGGTLDVSVVEYGEGLYEVKATAGDDRLGGDDFDQIIVDYLLENIKKELGTSVELNQIQQLVLKDAATKAKIELSDALTVRVYLPGFIRTENRNWDIDVSLDRNTFESLCGKLFDRAEMVLCNVLEDWVSSNFDVNEFWRQDKDVNRLCQAIENEGYGPPVIHHIEIHRLNGVLRIPDLYEKITAKKQNLTLTDEIATLKEYTEGSRKKLFKDLRSSEQRAIKKLNRLMIELAHPQETPKRYYEYESSITDLLLIGGTCRIPHIKERVSSIIGQPVTELAPEYVAHGASIYAGILDGKLKDILFLDVVPRSYGVQGLGGVFDKVIERNTTIPTMRSHILSTWWDNQTEFVVSVAEGEREMFAYNTFVGEFRLSGIPPALRGVPQIEVTMEIGANGILHVSAEDKATGRKIETRMEAAYGMNPAQKKVLQRKVSHELQLLQQREADVWRQRRYAQDRDRAMACIKEIDNFLTAYGASLEDKQVSLLSAGKGLIHDYLDRNVSHTDLKTLIDSIIYSRDDATISIMEHTVKSLVTSPLFGQWATEITDNCRTPKLLKQAQNEFKRHFNGEIDSIVIFFQQRDSDLQELLKQRLLTKIKDTSIETLCIAIVLSQFVNLDIDIKYLINIADVSSSPLLNYFLLYELSQRNSVTAAQEIYNLYKGSNCFFLCEYISTWSNDKNVWLEKSLKEIPAGVWFKYYLDSIPTEREWFKGNPIALKELYRDLIWGLGNLGVEAQLIALETLKELGIQGCLSDLLPLLVVKMDDRVKVKLITLVASSKNEQVILPLLKTLDDKSHVVRNTSLTALEEYRSMMSPDIYRFFELTQRTIARGIPLRFHEKFFLRKLASEHKELGAVIELIKGKKK